MNVVPLKKRKILVTGASGYIGRPVVRALMAHGCDVHIIGRNDPCLTGVTFHFLDLLDPIDLRATIDAIGAELLLHLAWSVTPGKFWTDLANCDWLAASITLFRAFVEAGGERILGVGSCAEYDWSTSPLIEETTPLLPKTLYGKAKASVWSMLDSIGQQEGVSTAWGRVFFLYGPGEPRGKLVADAINSLLEKKSFATTPGLQHRDFIYVEDAAEALATLGLSTVNGAVNIASGEAIQVRELLNQVAVATKTKNLIDFGARQLSADEPLILAADITRLRDEVGYKSRYTIADGVNETVSWWEKQISATSRRT